MKITLTHSFLLILAAIPALDSTALGDPYHWVGPSGSNWGATASWGAGVAPPVNGITTSDVDFSNQGAGTFVSNLNQAYQIRSLIFLSGASAFNLTGASITLGNGGLIQQSANAQNFSTAQVILDSDQTWTLGNGAGALTFWAGLNTTGGTGNADRTLTLTAGSNTGDGNVINGVILGGGSLIKNGSGILTLNGENTFSGSTTVSVGTLKLGNAQALSASTLNLSGSSGAVSFVSGITDFQLGGLAGSRNMALTNTAGNTATITVGANNASTSYSGILSGLGGLTKTGTGTLTLTGANTYNGATTISGGVLEIGNGGTSGTLGSADVVNNATLALNRSNDFTIANRITGTGVLTKSGAGVLTLTANNSYDGTTRINGGTLAVGAGNLSTGSLIVGDTGTGAMTQNGGTVTSSGAFILGNTAGASGSSYTLTSGTLSTGPMSIRNTGNFTMNGGSLTTNGNNLSVISGNFMQNGGELTTNGGSLFLTSAGANYTMNAGTLTAPSIRIGSNTPGNKSFTQTGGTVTTPNLVFEFFDDRAEYHLDGGTLEFQNIQISDGVQYFYANGGTLKATGSAVIGDAALGFYIQAGGARFDTNGNQIRLDVIANHDAGGPAIDGGLTKLGEGTLLIPDSTTYTGQTLISGGVLHLTNNANFGGSGNITNNASLVIDRNTLLTIANAISGTGTLTLNNVGTTVLTGNNTYSGVTTINDGTLQFGNGGTTGTVGSGDLVNNGTIRFNRSDNLTFSNNMTGTGGITKSGTGTLTFGKDYSYAGSTVVDQGTLNLGSHNLTTGSITVGGTGSSSMTQSGGTVTAASGVTLTAGGAYILNSGTLSAGTVSFTSPAATLQLNGGTLEFSQITNGSNAPHIHANGGTFRATANAGIGSSVYYYFYVQEGGARFDTNGFDMRFDTFMMHDQTAGAPAIDGGLTKLGEGTLLIPFTASYTGLTRIDAGVLRFTNNARLGTGDIVNNGSLILDRNQSYGISGAISGTGTLTLNNVGTTVLTGNNTYSGVTTINGGILQVGDGGAVGATGTGEIVNSGLLLVNRSGDFGLGAISGTGSFEKIGSGKVSITGAANYTGTTTLNGGILQLRSGSLPGVISGAGGIEKAGSGTLTLSGVNTFTGGLTIAAGKMSASSDAALGASSGSVSFTGGSLEYTGTTSTSRDFNLLLSSLNATSGTTVTYNGSSISGGFLGGAGTHVLGDGASLSGTTTSLGSNLGQTSGTASMDNVTLRGAFTQGAGATLNLTNTVLAPSGSLALSGTVNTQGFENPNTLIINNGGRLSNTEYPLTLAGGSRTTINAGGTLATAAGTAIELNGALLTNNGTQSGDLNVNYGGTAKGAGSFGKVTVTEGGTFSPGNSPGTVVVQTMNFGGGGGYLWEINNATGAVGLNSDLIDITGGLNFETDPEDLFVLSLRTLNAGNVSGSMLNFDPTQNYTWIFASADGGISGFDAGQFAIDTSGIVNNLQGGLFSIYQSGNDLNLQFTAVPEPSTYALMGMGLVGLVVVARRRRGLR